MAGCSERERENDSKREYTKSALIRIEGETFEIA
jgi:hypothetical protein